MDKYLCFLILIFIFKEISGIQKFAEQPKYTEVNPGQDALLICKILDKRGSCSWQKDNKPVGIYPKKYEWANGAPSSMGISSHLNGDCSLWVRSSTLDYDDGTWECQVTAGDFTSNDALTSKPVRLVVRVAPQRPRLEHEGTHIQPGHNITVDSGAIATVKCLSHYGNPPALLKWFLGDQEITPLHPQTNATEPDNPRTWSAASVVQVPINKERHGGTLKCLAFHESYTARSNGVEARMNVRYAPTIKLIGAPQIDVEEGKDSVSLMCEADANPPANIVWRRAGRSEIASLQKSLQLRPVRRRDSGLYTCTAQNSVGTSEALSVQLDIKYPPRILTIGPERLTTTPLYTAAAFECIAEGNPIPTFKWVQKISSESNTYLERGRESRLVIENATYDFQGEYECRATNFINGLERTSISDPINLQVIGAPQVIKPNPSSYLVNIKKGESTSLSLVVCADPRPRRVSWEWGSLRLEAGAGIGRFKVDEISRDSREDCYLATLHIKDADVQDSRPYYLVVENERGNDRHAIILKVEEPIKLNYLLGIAASALAVLFLLMCWCIYAAHAKICCFKNRINYTTTDKDSEKANLKLRQDSQIGVPYLDPIYTTPTGGFHQQYNTNELEPEAMKPPQSSANKFTVQQDADLVFGTHRHQRDLFSGPQPLGIPNLRTHVGSVVHAFESIALQTKLKDEGDKSGNSSKSGSVNSSQKSKQEVIHKISLPPPPTTVSTGTLTDPPQRQAPKNRKPKAPPVPFRSSSTQTNLTVNKKPSTLITDDLSYNENDSNNMDSLPGDEDISSKINNSTRKIDRNFSILPTTTSSQRESKIPVISKKSTKNQYTMPSNEIIPIRSRTDATARRSTLNYTDNIATDFFRGSNMNQSFSKEVTSRYSKNRLSTYEQNFLMPQQDTNLMRSERPRSSPVVDELFLRYKQYNSGGMMNNLRGTNVHKNSSFQPRTIDRAEI